MSIAVVMAIGANMLEIPCLTFATVEEAEAYLTDKCGPSDNGRWADCRTMEDETRFFDDLSGYFFRGYYDGCGGIGHLEVREVEHGQPFVCWNLD